MAYIGVTGFTTRAQVQQFLELIPDSPRKTMIGVLASYKSLRGIPQKPMRAERTPRIEKIAEIFPSHLNTLNLIHYNSEEGKLDTLADDLLKLEEMAGENLDGFQLNISWPPTEQLMKYYDNSRLVSKTIVLQINSQAIKAAGSPYEVGFALHYKYQGLIDDVTAVLFDFSGGRGEELDAAYLLEYLYAAHTIGFEVGVAGGLGPDTLHLLDKLPTEFPINIDAEGRLRNSKNEFDIGKALVYYTKAVKYFYPSI